MNSLQRREGNKTIDAFTTFFGGTPWTRDDFFRPFEQQLDSILNHFEGYGLGNLRQQSGFPKLDVISHDGKFVVEVAIPGVDPADVKVEIHPGEQTEHTGSADTLVISGRMARNYAREGAHYHVRELSRRAFSRSMHLPRNIEGDPEANFSNGMLTLTWKLSDAVNDKPKVRVIPVNNVALEPPA